MKGSIKKKFTVSYIVLILFFVVVQSLFNLFLAEPVFTYQKTVTIKQAFHEIKSGYTKDLHHVEMTAEEYWDRNGINILLWNETGILYSNQDFRADANALLRNKWGIASIEKYSDTPEVEIHDTPKANKTYKNLQLRGKFEGNGNTIYVLLSVPLASIQNNVKLFTQFTIVISLLIVFVAIFISIATAKRMSDPICSIEKIAKRISDMDFSCKADENVEIKEISMLAQSINVLSNKLSTTIDNLNQANQCLQKELDNKNQLEKLRQQFIASVSHEMKTPLALLQIYTENLKNNVEGIDKDYYCDTILEETNRLNRMILQMLEYSSIDTGFTTMNFEPFNLSELLRSIIKQYRPLLSSYDISDSIDNEMVINGDKEYVSQVIKNLLNNAIQHTEEHNQIRILLKNQSSNVSFQLFNQGMQIPEKDIDHIWDAFYRVDKARTRTNDNNIGFGLYIVKTIIQKHAGECAVKNEQDGVTFSFSLPLLNSEEDLNSKSKE